VNRKLSSCICGRAASGSSSVSVAVSHRVGGHQPLLLLLLPWRAAAACAYLGVPLDVSISLNDIARREPFCVRVVVRHDRANLGDRHRGQEMGPASGRHAAVTACAAGTVPVGPRALEAASTLPLHLSAPGRGCKHADGVNPLLPARPVLAAWC
jgi:hypothetical protein